MVEIIQYVELVARMRQAQRDYFRDRHPMQVQVAKQLERDVDRATAAVRAEIERVDREQAGQQQMSLLGGG